MNLYSGYGLNLLSLQHKLLILCAHNGFFGELCSECELNLLNLVMMY